MDDYLTRQGAKLCRGCNRVLLAADPDECPECRGLLKPVVIPEPEPLAPAAAPEPDPEWAAPTKGKKSSS